MNGLPRYLYYNLKVMHFTSMLNLNDKPTRLFKYWCYFWRSVCTLVVAYAIVFSYLELEFTSGTLISKSPTILNMIVNATVATRLMYFYICCDKTEKLIRLMFNTFKYTTETGITEKTMASYIKRTNIGFLVWFIIANLGAQMYTVTPLMLDEERSLPMPLWRPYDATKSPFYEITFVLEMFCNIVLVFHVTTTDILFTTMVHVTAGQYELLAWEFEYVCYTPLVSYGYTKEEILTFKELLRSNCDLLEGRHSDKALYDKVAEIMQTESYNQQLCKNFGKLIQQHTKLIHFSKEMEKYWSLLLIPMIMIAQGYLTFEMYVVISSKDNIVILQAVEYMLPILMEVTFISFAGESLLQQSEKLLISLYTIPWYLCNNRFRKLMQIVQMRCLRNAFITIGGFTAVGLGSYTWMMKSSFSYLAVLRKPS